MRWERLFDESPAARRRLVLVLYALVGPIFSGVLLLVRNPAGPRWAVAAVAGLILAGAAALLLQRSPTTRDWIFPVAIAPTVCCGLAFAACAPVGAAYLGVIGAPLAWAAVLFEAPVVLAAFATATVTCFAVLLEAEGPLAAVGGTAVFSTINGLVGWVVFGMSGHLRETKARLRVGVERDLALLRAIPDVLARIDRQGRFLDLRAPAGDPLPLPREQLIGRSVFEFLPSEAAPRGREAMERAFAAETVQVIDYQAPYGGVLRRFEARIAAVAADEALVIRRDVTELGLAQEALRTSDAQLRTLVANMQEAVISVGPDLRVRSWAGAAEAIYGWSEAEATGRGVAELVQPDLPPAEASAMAARVAAEGAARAVARQRRKDGTQLYVDASLAALRDEGGAVSGYLAVVRDVTEQKRAERELRRSEERLRLALAAGDHVAWDWDVERDLLTQGGGRDGAPAALVGEGPRSTETWRSLVHPEDREGVWRALQDCVEGRSEEYVGHYRLRSEPGRWRWIRSHGRATRRDAGGRALRIVGTRTDVTETEELNQRLMAATRLASVGTLAAGVAHEINNPLTWVKSNLAYCLERLAGPAGGAGAAPPGELRESLAEALQGADRIEAIVKAMRSLGRPERPDAVEEVDVRDELLNALQMARNHLTQRAALSIAVPPALPRVKAKTNELGRVFLNLLMNAAQAIPEGASAQNRVAVAARAEDGEVVVEVADTGCGLSDEVRARMFEPFFTTKPVGQGTGLGLTIARAIVDAAGGRLEAEREEGRGARFRVCLPAVGGEGAPEARRPATAAGARSRSRVLVIDDEPMVRRSFERMLERHHEVVGLDSAAEALARLEAGERWDAILCDLMMSGTDGIAFHEALSVRFPALLPRLAFVTGGAFGERATRFLAEHEVPVVPKPVEVAALLEAVERLAGGGRG
ncbi:MAG TPA: PAS domain S-box protein [Anaeromyxobacter sp.]|nr:PAS domain S-box protein [Anaeromyxobacter sp.]